MYVYDIEYEPLSYSVTPLGNVSVLVLSLQVREGPNIYAFLVDAVNLQRFESGEPFDHHGPGLVFSLEATLELDPKRTWSLVVENRDATTASVVGFGTESM